MEASSGLKTLLKKYYDSLSTRNAWGHLLSEDFLLSGTVVKETRGRDLYVNNNFFKMVGDLKVKELITEGETGFALVRYDLISPKGKPFSSEVAEFWKMKDEKLVSVAIYFDTAAFNSHLVA